MHMQSYSINSKQLKLKSLIVKSLLSVWMKIIKKRGGRRKYDLPLPLKTYTGWHFKLYFELLSGILALILLDWLQLMLWRGLKNESPVLILTQISFNSMRLAGHQSA